jgi:photosystem II stability/assembly factor-like uncharacterized protein
MKNNILPKLLIVILFLHLFASCQPMENLSGSLSRDETPETGKQQTPSITNEGLPGSGISNIVDITSLRGCILVNNSLYHTNDSGQVWSDVTNSIKPAYADEQIRLGTNSETDSDRLIKDGSRIFFFHKTQKTIAVSVSEDYCSTWTKLGLLEYEDHDLSGSQIVSISFPDSTNGWVLVSTNKGLNHEDVLVYRTKDSGKTWSLITDTLDRNTKNKVLATGSKNGITFIHEMNGWMTGNSHANEILLYRSQDGGETWNKFNLEVPNGTTAQGGSATSYQVVYVNGQIILPVKLGNEKSGMDLIFFYSTKKGDEFSYSSPVNSKDGSFFYSIIDDLQIKVIDRQSSILYSTENPGKAWGPISLSANVTQFVFFSKTNGWAIINDRLYLTTDAGENWSIVPIE